MKKNVELVCKSVVFLTFQGWNVGDIVRSNRTTRSNRLNR